MLIPLVYLLLIVATLSGKGERPRYCGTSIQCSSPTRRESGLRSFRRYAELEGECAQGMHDVTPLHKLRTDVCKIGTSFEFEG